jgi:hypothetical protein
MENMMIGCTGAELMQNLRDLMNDPKAQRKWAEELDKQGFWVSFKGPIPSITSKEIHVTEPFLSLSKERTKYWYKMHVGECPVCGRDASYKIRVKGEKPKDRSERYVRLPQSATYCGCVK